MIRLINCFLFGPSIIFCLASCHGHPAKTKKIDSTVKIAARPNHQKNKLLTVMGDSLRIAVNDSFIMVPKKLVVNYDSVYAGIYFINKNDIKPTFSTRLNDFIYFTTYDNVGLGYRGYLYAFDLKTKLLINSESHNESYIQSSGGIFFLDKKYIFSVAKPNHKNADAPLTLLLRFTKLRPINFII